MRLHPSILTLGCALAVGVGYGRAADDLKKPEERVAAGKCQSLSGSILRREAVDKPWQVVKENEVLYTGDLLVSGSQGSLTSANGAVRLSTMGSMTGIKEFPIIETAVILHEPKDVDLDFTLDRGRVDLVNLKKSGAALVRIRVGTHVALITLTEPGGRMIDEIYGRWPAGVHFKKNAKPEDGPELAVLAIALKGDVNIKGTHHEVVLKEPPGPAMVVLNHFGDHSPPICEKLENEPDWAKEGAKPEIDPKRLAAVKKFRDLALESSVAEAEEKLAKSDSIDDQVLSVFIMAATDNLELLGKTMSSTKHMEVWNAGVLALRHWIGRGPGQDQKLYDALVDKVKMKPVEAETVMQLLHSYGDDDLTKPETYEMLINYLKCDRLAIRGLAYWHLERLVPEGKKIGYSPIAPKEERDKAVQAWQDLLPPGKLPPGPKSEGSK